MVGRIHVQPVLDEQLKMNREPGQWPIRLISHRCAAEQKSFTVVHAPINRDIFIGAIRLSMHIYIYIDRRRERERERERDRALLACTCVVFLGGHA